MILLSLKQSETSIHHVGLVDSFNIIDSFYGETTYPHLKYLMHVYSDVIQIFHNLVLLGHWEFFSL